MRTFLHGIVMEIQSLSLFLIRLSLTREFLNKPYILFKTKLHILINYKSYLIFLFASLAVSIGLQMVLPFPYGLGAALALFIAFPLILRRRMMNRMRGGYGGGTGSGSGGRFGGLFGQNSESSSKIKYECLVCHKIYNSRECPRCGSSMKRAMF